MISNRHIAHALGTVNTLVALAILLGGMYAGATFGGVWGAFVGGCLGYLVAVLVCGVVALLMSIRTLLLDLLTLVATGERPAHEHFPLAEAVNSLAEDKADHPEGGRSRPKGRRH